MTPGHSVVKSGAALTMGTGPNGPVLFLSLILGLFGVKKGVTVRDLPNKRLFGY